jgi:plastocyanin
VPASLAENPTIEATGGANGYYWSPESAAVSAGGAVTLKSPSVSVPHGVTWTGGPETPSCSGVPVNGSKTSWSGSCTFAQAGTYSFYCPVHPTEMKGTITTSSSEAVPNPPPPPTGTPADGPPLKTLKLARNQRGGAVRGFVNLSQAGAGSRLRVELLAARALLFGQGRPGTMQVGKLVRSSLEAGRFPFTVSLKRVARDALRLHERLQLKVKITITPPGGDVLRRTRPVVLHG